jgi:hypothetical protein
MLAVVEDHLVQQPELVEPAVVALDQTQTTMQLLEP